MISYDIISSSISLTGPRTWNGLLPFPAGGGQDSAICGLAPQNSHGPSFSPMNIAILGGKLMIVDDN